MSAHFGREGLGSTHLGESLIYVGYVLDGHSSNTYAVAIAPKNGELVNVVINDILAERLATSEGAY